MVKAPRWWGRGASLTYFLCFLCKLTCLRQHILRDPAWTARRKKKPQIRRWRPVGQLYNGGCQEAQTSTIRTTDTSYRHAHAFALCALCLSRNPSNCQRFIAPSLVSSSFRASLVKKTTLAIHINSRSSPYQRIRCSLWSLEGKEGVGSARQAPFRNICMVIGHQYNV